MRLREARILFESGCCEGAFYLAGYSIECILKSIIAMGFAAHHIPERATVNAVYTHAIKDLLRLSGLEQEFERDRDMNRGLANNWNTVLLWNEQCRYSVIAADRAGEFRARTENLLAAIADPANGVMRWFTIRLQAYAQR